MFIYLIAIAYSGHIIYTLLSEKGLFFSKGMSKRFFNLFTAAFVCFLVCCFVSWIAAMCFFVPFSLAAPILCFNRFKGEVWRIDKYSYILATISIGSLALLYYQYNQYPNFDHCFKVLFLFAASTTTFYFVTCRKQLSYMTNTEEEMDNSKSKNSYEYTFYLIVFYFAIFLITLIYTNDFREKCKNKIYQKGIIYFCAEITNVKLSTHRGRYDSNLEYTVTTDYILPQEQKPFIFSELGESGSVDKTYNYKENPEKFKNSPYVPNKKVKIKRAYFDNRVFSLNEKHPLESQFTEYQRPIVEIDSKTYYLDTYADIDFLKNNLDFYYQYCGIKIVIKAVKIGEVNNMFIYNNSLLNNKIYHKPETENNPDTLLFYKTIYQNKTSDSDWICLKHPNQTSENRSKISDYGYYFNDKIWSKEEFEGQVNGLEIPRL